MPVVDRYSQDVPSRQSPTATFENPNHNSAIPILSISAPFLENVIQVHVRKTHLKAIIDTGAQRSVIGLQTLQSIPKHYMFSQITPKTSNIRLADGALVRVLGAVVLPIKLKDAIYNQDFIV